MSTTQRPVGPSPGYHPPPPSGQRWVKIAVRIGVPMLIVSSGQLKGLAGHRGSGAASIVRTPDGSHVVQLEDYDVSSGLTLFLYVVPGANQEPGANIVNLGRLAENTGNRRRHPVGSYLGTAVATEWAG